MSEVIEEVIKKPKSKGVQYFTQDTEDAIVLYNNTLDQELRDKIYRTRIHYAFFKLTENIIHTFKFYYTEVDNIEDLQHEVITFLLSKLHLFNPEKGAKAYSYFGTIAKRYLINSNNKNYKKRVEKASIDELDSNEDYSYRIDEPMSENDRLIHFIDQYVEYCTENINELFPKQVDAQIADAILELFRKRENIDIFNKKALYIYIREIIDAKTPKITKIADRLYTIFKQHYYYYLENGHTDF
jgi:DNA-directed RNA polymerase specialized sigma24 family protein